MMHEFGSHIQPEDWIWLSHEGIVRTTQTKVVFDLQPTPSSRVCCLTKKCIFGKAAAAGWCNSLVCVWLVARQCSQSNLFVRSQFLLDSQKLIKPVHLRTNLLKGLLLLRHTYWRDWVFYCGCGIKLDVIIIGRKTGNFMYMALWTCQQRFRVGTWLPVLDYVELLCLHCI